MILLLAVWTWAAEPEPVARAVALSEFSVAPAEIDVSVGTRVRLSVRNDGAVVHRLVLADLHVSTDALQPGETQVVTFTASEAGTFLATCGIPGHDRVGATGAIVAVKPEAAP